MPDLKSPTNSPSYTGLPLPRGATGRAATELIATLLETSGGYIVQRTGVEEQFPDVKHVDARQDLNIGFPHHLRRTPDLLVWNPRHTKARQTEVKYRQQWTANSVGSIYSELREQRKSWPDSYAVIVRGEVERPYYNFHYNYIRVVPPTFEHWLDPDRNFLRPSSPSLDETLEDRLAYLWSGLPHITHSFELVQTKHAEWVAGKIREFASG